MSSLENCPACGASATRSHPVLTAPFIAAYVLERPIEPCRLMICDDCGLWFFDRRYSDAEMAKLYGNYRGDGYFEVRHHFEPWYTRAFNDHLGRDPKEIAARNAATSAFLEESDDRKTFATILDYGGDSGQFMPPGLGGEKFVYELSDAPCVPGVTRIADKKDFAAEGYDLVMLCHVLEHAPDPASMLREMHAYLAGPEARLYVEVPYERGCNLKFAPPTDAYRAWLKFVTRLPAPLITLLDFYSSGFRDRFSLIPPLGFFKMHEHINFFDALSLKRALEATGYQVVHCATEGRCVRALAHRPA
ncbi:hypothetical protein M2323_003097 [Rhodoblastus acidophilus]|uniref:class I SAM-dependent methyltransferase n=1 Tax=Rhodoblastus acidophilus TaxID=1074 RepID=UPI002223F6E6|nr:class I SAM-dependent methyltransferase [Rhodoblastus acidophilus]MCW2285201.1 hypothetical protein [Rhodoblastus acidophilus]MCW2334157.1 hypothetical protein [Rhodoblastus acidophilus]